MKLFIMPHPPLAIPEIGKGKEQEIESTIDAMKKIAKEIKEIAPKTIALISPHGNVFSDGLCINIEDKLAGSFEEFDKPNIQFNIKGDMQKALVLCSGLRASGINCLALDEFTAKKYEITTELDHGAMVPLYYILKEYTDFKLIHINAGFLTKVEMYQAGKILSEILGDDNIIIASGDLSHRLSKESKEDYDVMGEAYDKYITSAIENNELIKILSADDTVKERAGQCAHKPMEMLLGAVDGCGTRSRLYSYEAPFGVGYMVAGIERIDASKENLIDQYLQIKKSAEEERKLNENEYVKLAKNTIEHYVKNKEMMDIPEDLSEELYIHQGGVFVSIKRDGNLRGCIGTVAPTQKSIAEEIMNNAVEAASKDSRFTELQEEELDEIEISVDVLSPLEDVADKSQLDIKKYGVVVTKGYKRGLLLPDIEGVKSVDHQIDIALEKAGIKADEGYTLQRFTVERHKRFA